MTVRLEHTILDLLDSTARNLKAQPLNLGGISGPSGGVGGPPAGFIGWLVQTRVSYDETEDATLFTPASGMSLVDNLNHIRYRLNTLEASSGILTVDEWDGTPTVELVEHLTFSGAVVVTELSPGHALVTITASGGGGTPLTVQNSLETTIIDNVNKISFGGMTVTDQGDGEALVLRNLVLQEQGNILSIVNFVDKILFSGATVTDLGDGDALVTISGSGGSSDGWNSLSATFTYSSADDPTYIISSDTDLTNILSVGMKIKFTNNSTTFFGFITAIGSWSGSAQLITLYGGTDYDVANSAITNPYYSREKAPFGFPTTPVKWTVTLTDTTQRSQTSPTQNTWYNIGSLSISIPIGVWNVSYKVMLRGQVSGVTANMFGTLSTANNSESDADFTTAVQITTPTGTVVVQNVVYTAKTLTLASKTSYYLNGRTTVSGQDHIMFRNDVSGLIINAECAYL